MNADIGPLRRLLEDTAQSESLSMKALTVLAVNNDPFRIDTPAGHRDGYWIATNLDRLVPAGRQIHLRGLHYVLVTDATIKPNGSPYRNTDADWFWLQDKAADAARWLGYVPFERIVDRRNEAPVVREFETPEPSPYFATRLRVEIPSVTNLKPYVGADEFDGVQPYKLVIVGEKSSLAPVLDPIAETYSADLYLPTGEISDYYIHRIATVGRADGRPVVVLYFADCDPAGHQMGISVARKLQALQALGIGPSEWELHRVALTPDQVRRYELPSTPLKDTERRADRWRQATGVQQTEIDALAALQPDLLRELAKQAIECFYDTTLEPRVDAAYEQWRREAQAALDDVLDAELLEQIRADAAGRLRELREQIDQINEALRIDPGTVELPAIEVPTAELDGRVYGVPLLDSRESFAEQTRRLIESKAYAGENGGAA